MSDEGDARTPHLSMQRTRFSSTNVDGKAQQLLSKWTDLAEANGFNGGINHMQTAVQNFGTCGSARATRPSISIATR